MTYHEYFIGGPMDGQTRNNGLPKVSMIEAYEYIDLLDAPEYSPQKDTGGYIAEPFITWQYHPRRVFMGPNIVLTFWVSDKMLSEDEIFARLWEIILEPHKFIPDVSTERRTAK